jgi:hypothetical protein
MLIQNCLPIPTCKNTPRGGSSIATMIRSRSTEIPLFLRWAHRFAPRPGCTEGERCASPKRGISRIISSNFYRTPYKAEVQLRRTSLPRTPVNKGIKKAWLSSGKDRVLRGFGISALTTTVLFGGEALSPGGRWPLLYDQKCFAGVRGQSRRIRCHPPRSATSLAVRDL